MNQSGSRRRFGLDVMRAAAIVGVLLSHMANGFEWVGFYGVEVFFALSGFLIGGLLLRSVQQTGRFEAREFLKRRWYRTLPNYYLFLLIFFAIQLTHPIDGTISATDLPKYCVFLQNFAWPRPSFFGVSWSLCVEEWFYVLVAVSLVTLRPRFRPTADGVLNAMMLVGVAFVILPLILRLAFPPTEMASDQRMIVIYRLDAIMYGVIMAALKARASAFWASTWHTATAGVAVIIISHALANPANPTHFAFLLSTIPLGFSLLLPLFDSLAPVTGWFGIAVERASVWSYSMYLCHIPIYIGLKPVVGYDALPPLGKLLFKAGSLILIVGVSALLYRYYEKPITDLRDRTRPKLGKTSSSSSMVAEAIKE